MIEKVISGGQAGVDLAAWDAALRAGLATGGLMPDGFLAEDGRHPEFAARYGAVEGGPRLVPGWLRVRPSRWTRSHYFRAGFAGSICGKVGREVDDREPTAEVPPDACLMCLRLEGPGRAGDGGTKCLK